MNWINLADKYCFLQRWSTGGPITRDTIDLRLPCSKQYGQYLHKISSQFSAFAKILLSPVKCYEIVGDALRCSEIPGDGWRYHKTAGNASRPLEMPSFYVIAGSFQFQ